MIVGAGLAGLIAAHIFRDEPLIEAAPEPLQMHKALLRFRSEAVSNVTGIPFRAVMVRKGIWHEGGFHAPSIRLANLYSQKCLGTLLGGDRSIWQIDPVTRFIAPEDFYLQLLGNVEHRITWGERADFASRNEDFRPMISTAPMDVVARALGVEDVRFDRAPIVVKRFRVHDCKLHQTIYFPSEEHSMYRASITDDLLIVEFACAASSEAEEMVWGDWAAELVCSFGLNPAQLEELEGARQRYGKIAPINDAWRKSFIGLLTSQRNIYSIGRFATWKNILLDDVVQDAAVIKRLMHASPYERRLHHHKEKENA